MSQILHKEFDFTQPGGFPLTQERLQYMQEATGEAVTALIAAGGGLTGPMIISGMRITEPVPGTFVVTDGWFIYNGRMVKFTGGTVIPSGGDVLLVTITQNTTDITFYNTSTPPVQLSTTASLSAAPSITDSTHFPLFSATQWASGVGAQQRDDEWKFFTFADPHPTSTSGTIRYKRNRFTNTVHIRGEIHILDPHNPAAFGLAGTEVPFSFGSFDYLPAGMTAGEKIQILNCTSDPSDPSLAILDFNGKYFNSWKIEIDETGTFWANVIRPHSSVAAYRVYINHIFSLD